MSSAPEIHPFRVSVFWAAQGVPKIKNPPAEAGESACCTLQALAVISPPKHLLICSLAVPGLSCSTWDRFSYSVQDLVS